MAKIHKVGHAGEIKSQRVLWEIGVQIKELKILADKESRHQEWEICQDKVKLVELVAKEKDKMMMMNMEMNITTKKKMKTMTQ